MTRQKKISLMVAIFVTGALGFSQVPGMPPAEDGEGLSGGKIIAQLLLKGPSLDGYCDLADAFFEDSRPIQARYFFQKALSLKADGERAVEGLKKADERLAYLDERFSHYKQKAATGESVRNYCSMAAIQFHLGFPEKAIKILGQADLRHGTTIDSSGLKATFLHAIDHEKELLQRLQKEMQMAIMKNDADETAVIYGRIMFISLGNKEIAEKILEAQALMPDRFNSKAAEAIMGMSDAQRGPLNAKKNE